MLDGRTAFRHEPDRFWAALLGEQRDAVRDLVAAKAGETRSVAGEEN
ncbi:hypothetical protein [Actinophytocola sp.]